MLSDALKVRLRSRLAACDRLRVFSLALSFGMGGSSRWSVFEVSASILRENCQNRRNCQKNLPLRHGGTEKSIEMENGDSLRRRGGAEKTLETQRKGEAEEKNCRDLRDRDKSKNNLLWEAARRKAVTHAAGIRLYVYWTRSGRSIEDETSWPKSRRRGVATRTPPSRPMRLSTIGLPLVTAWILWALEGSKGC
jgi:hypothetical protein